MMAADEQDLGPQQRVLERQAAHRPADASIERLRGVGRWDCGFPKFFCQGIKLGRLRLQIDGAQGTQVLEDQPAALEVTGCGLEWISLAFQHLPVGLDDLLERARAVGRQRGGLSGRFRLDRFRRPSHRGETQCDEHCD